jgi:Abnormal spindle-like microcephaly-assoc'd, ASPM-SPD-2-Hydin
MRQPTDVAAVLPRLVAKAAVLSRRATVTAFLRRPATMAAALVIVLVAGGLLIAAAVLPSGDAKFEVAPVDTLRTDWDSSEAKLSVGSVLSSDFGQLFATQLDGQIYAQPLVVGNTVLVSTENDWAYGLDAATGHIKWSRNFGAPWPASQSGCADLQPNIGNTSTGVYDSSGSTYYVTTKVNDGPDANHPNWYLQALDIATGKERPGWPVKIVGTPANDPSHPFTARDANQRPGLLLLGGAVYMAFGSHCGYGSYVGWVAGVNVDTKQISMWSDESGAANQGSGIWQGGGGLVSDGAGRIFLTTGNGVTAPDGPGSTPPRTLSESVVRLDVKSDGSLAARDFFSPSNAALLDVDDQDLGSGGPVALPDQYFGNSKFRHLMVQMGKDGRLFLLNRDDLGGKSQGHGGSDAVLQSLGPFHGQWGHPAVYGGNGGYIYFMQAYSSMLVFKYGVDGSGQPALSLAGNTPDIFGYTSGSPLVTSYGTSSGSAVVWVTKADGPTGANGQLCAYNGVPTNGTLTRVRCFPVGTASKFSVPGSGGGRVYVGTRDGKLIGIGAPVNSLMSFAEANFGDVGVGDSSSATIVAKANAPLTITAASTSAPFSLAPSQLPVTLPKGGQIRIPATFAPTVPGSVTGVASLTVTSGAKTLTFGVAMQGRAVKPGFTATPPTLEFGDVPLNSTVALTENFTNTGTNNEKIAAIVPPSSAFTVAGLPKVGSVLAPGASVAVSVTFAPKTTGAVNSSMTFVGADGSGVATLKANGVVGVKRLTIKPAKISFGSVEVGSSATKILNVSNTGNLSVMINQAAPPATPFEVNAPLAEGLVLAPGDKLQIPVTFVPTASGTVTGHYVISSDDGAGAHHIDVTGRGIPASGNIVPSPASGAWKVNGAATISGSQLVLTPPAKQQVGTAVFSAPVASDGLTAKFTASIGGGNGADGLTFALLDASNAMPSSVGVGGGGLGFSNLKGVAVALDTYQGPGDPASNFIGITTMGSGPTLKYAASATNVPNLRSGSHVVSVKVSGGRINVSIDGTAVLSAAVPIPTTVLPAFTAGTGGSVDRHAVSAVSISARGTKLPAPWSGWRLNGSATTSGGSMILTNTAGSAAGSLIYPHPVTTSGLDATFNLSMNGGTGGNGAAFNLLSPSESASSVGASGDGLGFAGLSGVSVQFVTSPTNRILIKSRAMTVASTTAVPNLRDAIHAIGVSISGRTVSVRVDGTRVLRATVTDMPRTALAGYSASTGAQVDVHAVSESLIIAG